MVVETTDNRGTCRLCGNGETALRIQIRIADTETHAQVCAGCLATAQRTLERTGFRTAAPAGTSRGDPPLADLRAVFIHRNA